MNRFIILAVGVFWSIAGFSAASAQEAIRQNSGQWQLTFDVIRSKVTSLLQQNEQLSAEYQSLQQRQKKLWHVIDDQSAKNDAARQFLKERDGKTDQQLRIEELEGALKTKKIHLAARQREAGDLKNRSKNLQNRVNLKKLKISAWELRQNAPKPAAPVPSADGLSGDHEVNALRKDLEAQKAEEARLEDQLASLTKPGVPAEIKLLQQKLKLLLAQKAGLRQKAAGQNQDGGDRLRYDMMIRKKTELESRIRGFEAKVNAFKDARTFGMSWAGQKKKMIRDIVQADARNEQLREKINNLREDITLLKDQIARLERRAVKHGKKR